MGHYAAEMMCQKCCELRCVCPRLPAPEDNRWVVWNYSARQAKELTLRERMGATMYATEAEALAAIPAAIDARIAALKAEIQRLNALRHNVRGKRVCPQQEQR